MTINDYLLLAFKKDASDIHISIGRPVTFRIRGELEFADDETVTADLADYYTCELMNEGQKAVLKEMGEVDFAFSLPGIARFRVNVFMQRNTYAAAIRLILSSPPKCSDLGLPESVIELTNHKNGLVLVVGPTGSGKSTTLAALINRINQTRAANIITIEDPIEYLHKNDKSIIRQREIGSDTKNYTNALRAVLRQDPDVILIGEMRDLETIATALTAAETGHLVFATLHTVSAAKTIDRITDSFPTFQQNQIRLQLSTVLRGIVSQKLLVRSDKKGRIAAFEVLISNPAICNLIRENKTNQIINVMQTNRKSGMITMDSYLSKLMHEGHIDYETAKFHSEDKDNFDNSYQRR